ncbi:MAG: SusC/RagA family TonB-linked outer membrane protein [Gemmatimonadales bacterium]
MQLDSRIRRLPVVLAGIALAMFGTGEAVAQATGSLRGTVTEAGNQRPVPNAGVLIVERNLRATTDANGVYQLRDVPAGQYTVTVRAIGFSPLSRPVTIGAGAEATLDLSVERTVIKLDELVVTGTAGQTSRREVGNSVTSLQVSDLVDVAPIQNVTELLNARSPGLTLTSNSGLLGTGSAVQIRGAGSLNAGYVPVYYVDGIRFEASPVTTGGVTNSTVQYSSPLDFINPADIERVEVIKGPAAATLYGADAAGGVIQIITKKGIRGSDRVQWQASFGYAASEWKADHPLNYYQCNASRIRNATSFPGCNNPAGITFMTKDGPVTGIPESDIMRYGDSLFVIVDDPLFRDPAALRTGGGTDLKLSARGGSQTFGYFVSFNRLDEDGIFRNNFQQRNGGRANFDFTPSSKLSMGVNFGYTRTHYQMPLSDNASNGLLRNAFRGKARATIDPWSPGWFGFGPEQTNEFDLQTFEERTTLGFTTNFNPFPWFENRLVLGMDKYDRRDRTFYQIDPTRKWGATAGTGQIIQRLPVTHTWTLDYAGTARAQVSEQLVTKFSTGVQLNARQFRRYTASGDGLVANNLNLIGAAANTQGDEGFSEQTSLGVFLQNQIGWKDRLYATAAVRIDDNSAFGADFSLVAYPKFSLAWVVSEEPFFNWGFVDELKLRAAYGQAGNAPAPFSADRTFSPEVATVDNVSVNALTPAAYGNTDLKAETGSEFEIGFDASILKGAVGLEFTYYNNHTKDALMSIPDPPSTGFTGSHLVNVGEIANRGVELLAQMSPVRSRKFTWDMTVSLAMNSNELVSFGGTRNEIAFGAFTNSQRHREGYPLGGFWAVDVVRNPDGSINLDGSGNVTVDNTCSWPDTEDPNGRGGSCHEIYQGPSSPTREIGFANVFNLFGNLRLYTQLDYKGGHYIVCAICSIRNRINTNTWEVVDPDADPAEVKRWLSTQTLTHIMPADFLKLREISLTYDLPAAWGRAFRATRWSVTASARNLFTTTKYKGSGDPEVSFVSSPGTFDRTDYASVPAPRRLSVFFNVSF